MLNLLHRNVFRPGIFSMFLNDNYLLFSNHSAATNDPNKIFESNAKYGYAASLEVVHDSVHDAVGGNGGHMQYPDIAGGYYMPYRHPMVLFLAKEIKYSALP